MSNSSLFTFLKCPLEFKTHSKLNFYTRSVAYKIAVKLPGPIRKRTQAKSSME